MKTASTTISTTSTRVRFGRQHGAEPRAVRPQRPCSVPLPRSQRLRAHWLLQAADRGVHLLDGCPLQAKFESVNDVTAASGKRQRCVADTPDASEDIGVTELVATSCCQLLCDDAKWDDPATKDTCRGSDGRFAAHACCEMNDDDGCGDAVWESRAQDEGLTRCWATSGDFADKYATNACCMDQCFLDNSDRVADPGNFPLECLLPTDDECAGATVTGEGTCQLDLTADQRQDVGEHVGDWGKAMCCVGQDGLDIDLADECHRRDVFGGDLSICG